MTESRTSVSKPIRISAEEVLAHIREGQPLTVLDARSQQAWSEGRQRVRGDIRIDRDHLHIDPTWPKDRLTVVYCT